MLVPTPGERGEEALVDAKTLTCEVADPDCIVGKKCTVAAVPVIPVADEELPCSIDSLGHILDIFWSFHWCGSSYVTLF